MLPLFPRRALPWAVLLAALLALLLPASASAGTIRGTVNELAGNVPISDVTVALYGADRTKVGASCTDSTGSYSFQGLDTGSYYVEFAADPAGTLCTATGYASAWYPAWKLASNATPVDVTSGQETPGINGALVPEATISGTVEDANQTGIERVSVRVRANGAEASRACTGAGGTYTVGRLNDLPYSVQFVSDATCNGGPGANYPVRYYTTASVFGTDSEGGAAAVNGVPGGDVPGIDVRLSLQYGLTTTVTGPGTVTSSEGGISCPGTCFAAIPANAAVALVPTAQAGSTFSGWTGDCAGAGGCVVTMDGDKTVGATFTTPAGGGGGGTGGGGGGTGGAAPPTPPPPASGTRVTPKAKCAVGSPSKVKRGRFTVGLRCDRRAKLAVGGTVRFKRGRKTTAVKLARTTTTATTKRVSIKLPAKALRAMKAKRRLSVSLALTATTTGGTAKVVTRSKRLR